MRGSAGARLTQQRPCAFAWPGPALARHQAGIGGDEGPSLRCLTGADEILGHAVELDIVVL